LAAAWALDDPVLVDRPPRLRDFTFALLELVFAVDLARVLLFGFDLLPACPADERCSAVDFLLTLLGSVLLGVVFFRLNSFFLADSPRKR
jgi:hypothetical protein